MKPRREVLFLFVAVVAGCSQRSDGGALDAAPSATAALSASGTVVPAPLASAAGAPSGDPGAEPHAVAHASEHAGDAGPPGPSVLGGGTVDGASLRKRHVDRLKSDRSPVTVLRGDSALSLGEAICEAVVPRRPKDTPVLLKPNVCGFDSLKDPAKSKGDDGLVGRITDPEFTRGVVRCLKKRGHERVTIAEGCGHSNGFWRSVARLSGYEAMAAEEGVALVAMDDDGVFDVEGDRPGKPMKVSGLGATRVPTLLLPKILAETLDRGLFISLPKIKAHRFSVVSLAIKGMQGTVMLSDAFPAYKQKYRMHDELGAYLKARKEKPEDPAEAAAKAASDRRQYLGALRLFGERMVDVLEVSAPDVVLADGAPAMGGDGFQVLYPSAEKLAIGGTNPVLVDKVGAQVLGLWDNARLGSELGGSRTSPLIEIAAKRFKLDLAAVEVTGSGADLLRSPRPVHFKAMAPFAIHSDATPPWAPLREGGPAAAPPPSATASAGAPATSTPATAATGAQGDGPAAATGGRPEAHAAPLGAGAIAIDGRGDDEAWSRAPEIRWDTDYAGRKTGTVTRARFLWSKDALYVLFELSGAGLRSDTSRPTATERAGLYQEDCVEIFLTPAASEPGRYFEVELGPFGHFFDLDVRRGAKEDTAWSSGARIGTTRRPAASEATIEAALGAPEIAAVLGPGARLPLGLYRMEGAGTRQYLAWSPPRTAKPNFHVPEAFGTLVLDR